MKCSLGIFLKRSLVFPVLLFLCIDRWGRLLCLSLLFLGTLHSDAYIFPFLLYFSLLFFSQLFVRPPQIAILLFCISFPWGWSLSLSPVQCHEPQSIVHQALYQIESLKSISHFYCVIIQFGPPEVPNSMDIQVLFVNGIGFAHNLDTHLLFNHLKTNYNTWYSVNGI